MADLHDIPLDVHVHCMIAAAEARGIPATVVHGTRRASDIPKPWLRLEIGGRAYLYRSGVLLRAQEAGNGAFGRHINGPAASITSDKALTKAVLAAAGVSTPAGAVFERDEAREARLFFEALGRPACVKPNAGRKGILVSPNLTDPAAFDDAFAGAGRRYTRVIVEESVSGEVIRYYYVAPRAVAVKLSLPANVVGDGASPIAALIEAKNAERARRAVPGHFPITVDADLLGHIAGHGWSLDSVPAAGERVLLRAISNGAKGADSIACADTTHPSYAGVVEAACRAIPGLAVAAIDMMIGDRSRPAAAGNHWILEINSSPGVVPYHHPWEGERQDVCGAILDFLALDFLAPDAAS